MDFYQIKERSTKNGTIEVYPDFKVTRSKDLMVRAKTFYAIWDPEKGLWSTDEYDVQRLVDKELMEYRDNLAKKTDNSIHVKLMSEFSTRAWAQYRNYLALISDNAHQLDMNLTFSNMEITKKDYVSRRLPYPLEEGDTDAYDQLMSTLYALEEREKLEWAIGAIIAGEAKDIQKFIVLYGEGGSGKSTFLNIVQKLFAGYYTTFEAKALTSSNNSFSTEVFRNNPLVAIQHDGDLSKIEDNTKLNSIISHEEMTMNEKYKPSYTAKANSFLFMATNKPVKITDAKSGIIRRLIDVHPTGNKLPITKYHNLMSRIDFELGAIAYKCLQVYRETGKNYYSNYRPLSMILETDIFFNFIEAYYFTFLEQGGVSLSQAYTMYKAYCEESLIEYKLPKYKFREELKNYFNNFYEVTRIDGKQVRSYYSELLKEKFSSSKPIEVLKATWLSIDSKISKFDEVGKDFPAQYANRSGLPARIWSNNKSYLKDLDTSKLHYVKLPQNHIVIDFDIKNDSGEKSAELNLEAASKFPPTYAEFSKSGSGVHLHYIYDGDVSRLSNLYSVGIEVKVFNGDASLRRKLSTCNALEIATINAGLPLKKEKMINADTIKTERGLRELIKRNLQKEIHPGTKPSIDFIYAILDDAYKSGFSYDVRDMRNAVLAFANNSTNHSSYCVKLVSKMRFNSEELSTNTNKYEDDKIVFFDTEVFPNLFLLTWKFEGEKNECIHLINPSPVELEELFKYKLVGFNCRKYDNHIMYARYIGYSIEDVYELNKKIINGNKNAMFGEAYNISYTDVYDFSSLKQSLKKFEIELGIHHQELGLPFDSPVPEEKWPLVMDYCENDVRATEAVFVARKEDFIARQILADLSGLSVNDTTQMHTAKIIFGDDPKPQDKFVYTDLSEIFPGYKFELGKSSYKGENPGEGGYVYAEPGYYEKVALLDVASMHPTSIELLNVFGPYTRKFSEIKMARLAIKHKDFDMARKMLGGILEKYLEDTKNAAALSYALKIVINIVYGLTSAKFDNRFRDIRNVDNIVAKRGALFMIELKQALQSKGYQVVHIKTDSVKIPNASQEVIDFVCDFGKKYGYEFEHEITYDKLCLVNDSVYIARKDKEWTAVGAEFAHSYIFKELFSKEPILFQDLCETKSVTTALYLDMNEDLGEDHNYIFVGRTGSFCPIMPGYGGGLLLREKEGKYYAATGSKGFRWLQAEHVLKNSKEDHIDLEYFRMLIDKAIKHIEEFVDFETFIL